MKYLVLDTNVYLHFKHFEQIDWKLLVGDDVTICVPQRVMVEIDKHKDQSRGKIQKRAKSIAARFGEVFLDGAIPQVPLQDMPNPPATAFNDPQYHEGISDDWIILSALHSTVSNTDIIIVAYDNGILLKAKQHGLGFYKMPESLLLTEELSDDEKEIKRLNQQLAKYENRKSQPMICFDENKDHITFTNPKFGDIEKELEQYEQQLKAAHPYTTAGGDSFEDLNAMASVILQFNYSSPEQRQEYNKELDKYYENMVHNKRMQLVKSRLDQRFQELNIFLCNKGNAAMGNTNVFLSFPENVRIYDESAQEEIELDEVKEPVLKNRFNELSMTNFNDLLYGKKSQIITLWNIGGYLRKSDLQFRLSELNHNMVQNLTYSDKVYVDVGQCGNFTIDWTIIDSSLPEPVEGQLHVIVKDQD